MNKKGFTLIELLAVIVILAVIALIVTPVITGIIDEAKQNAKIRSAEGYFDSVNTKIVKDILNPKDAIKDGIYTLEELATKGVRFKGEKPTNGIVTIVNGKIENLDITFDNTKVSLSNNGNATLSSAKVYGLKWDGNDNYTRLYDAIGLTSCVGTDTTSCTSNFDNEEIYNEIHDVVEDGNTFVYIPKFYIKKTVIGDTWGWFISKEKKDDNYYLPECFHDIETNSELPYVLVGKYEASLDSTRKKLESKTNIIPLVDKKIDEFRTYAYANNSESITGYQLLDIHTLDMLQTLFYIEFGTLNSQKIMKGYVYGQNPHSAANKVVSVNGNNIEITSGEGEKYKDGQLIDIATEEAKRDVVTNLKIKSIIGDILTVENTPWAENKATISSGNVVYNVANINGQTDIVSSKSGSSISNTRGEHSMKYRGIENLYGGLWQFVDGINIDGETNQVYVNKNSKTYESDKINGEYKQINYKIFNNEGWVLRMGFDSSNPFIQLPVKIGANYSTSYGDYYYQETSSDKRIVVVGGNWTYGNDSGLTYYRVSDNSSYSSLSVGARLVKKAK